MTQERTFREVERGRFINLGETTDDDGDKIISVEGTFVEGDTIQFDGGPAGRYTLDQESGERVQILGSQILDEMMEKVEPGQYVRVTLKDTKVRTKKGREMKDFKVEVAD